MRITQRRTLASAFLLAAAATLPAFQQEGAVIAVPAGGDLQAAIDRARPGDTIALEPGATFVGNFVLPAKNGDRFITIRTAEDTGLPPATERIDPEQAPQLAKLKSANSTAVLRTAPAAHHWRLQLLEFQANRGGGGDVVLLGDGSRDQDDLSEVPHDLIVDRCYVHGDPAVGQKRGIALNSASTTIINSYISDIKAVGQDNQAIAGWNGPGPFVIENNYLEAAGENFMMGGAAVAIRNLVPTNITFRHNHVSKPVELRQSPRWTVKNLFELKSGRRVLVEGNLFEYNWRSAQPGFAIVLTPRGSEGVVPWAIVEDITFRSNIVRHVAAVFNVAGEDNVHTSGPTRRILIANNLFYDVDHKEWGGNGVFLQVGNGPSDITVEHNTILHTGNLISAYGGTKEHPQPIVGFTFENNIARHNSYGVFGNGRAYGDDSLATFFPGVVFTHNVLAGGNPSRYPGGNLFPSVQEFESQFVNVDAADYHLIPTSRWKGAATDGTDLGAAIDTLKEAMVRGRAQRTERPQREGGPGRGRGGRGSGV